MINRTVELVNSTYQRDGKWYTLRAIDRSNQVEDAATADEIAAAQKDAPVEHVKEAKPAPKGKKAHK